MRRKCEQQSAWVGMRKRNREREAKRGRRQSEKENENEKWCDALPNRKRAREREKARKSNGTLGIQNMISPMNTPINAIDKIFIDSIEIDMSFMARLVLSFVWSVFLLGVSIYNTCHAISSIFIRIASHVYMYILCCNICTHFAIGFRLFGKKEWKNSFFFRLIQ